MKLFRYLLLLSIVFAADGYKNKKGAPPTPSGSDDTDPCLFAEYAEAHCALPPFATPLPRNALP